jgi:peptide/nickel transport system substrate-binding protein
MTEPFRNKEVSVNNRFWTRLIGVFMVAVLVAACGGAPPAQTPPTEVPAEEPAEEPTEAPAEEPTEVPAEDTEAPAEEATEAPAEEPMAEGEFTRGEGDLLRILYWQAPTTLNTHLSTGTKDYDASRLILEPLASIGPDGELIPELVAEIPTVENGGVAEDLSTITWTLRDDVVWSDGTPFTAEDVVFTYEYCADAATACTTAETFQGIAAVEAVDDYTVTITWESPNPNFYKTFTSTTGRVLQKAQFENCIGEAATTDAACQEANLAPIGTGPYVLEEFRPGDVAIYSMNENFRDPNKPFFQQVEFKGGGDAPSAARAVFQTGDTDWAWNLQVEAAVLDQLVSQGGQGTLVTYNTSNVERLLVNFTDVNPELGDQRGELDNPHPFLTDPAVREALKLAIDRQVIAEQLYGAAGIATCEILGYEPFVATEDIHGGRNDCLQDLDRANQLLDEAGWIDENGDGIREKDGVELRVLFQTSVNSLRQKTQELIKQWWAEIGVETELKSVDAGVFFGADAGNPDNIGHFFADIQMYTTGASQPDPTAHLCQWTSDQVSQAANEWRGNNNMRWQNEEYDALCEQLKVEIDPEERINIALQMNDLVVNDGALLPLIARGRVAGAANNLRGYNPSGWDSEMYDIANWYMVEE